MAGVVQLSWVASSLREKAARKGCCEKTVAKTIGKGLSLKGCSRKGLTGRCFGTILASLYGPSLILECVHGRRAPSLWSNQPNNRIKVSTVRGEESEVCVESGSW